MYVMHAKASAPPSVERIILSYFKYWQALPSVAKIAKNRRTQHILRNFSKQHKWQLAIIEKKTLLSNLVQSMTYLVMTYLVKITDLVIKSQTTEFQFM